MLSKKLPYCFLCHRKAQKKIKVMPFSKTTAAAGANDKSSATSPLIGEDASTTRYTPNQLNAGDPVIQNEDQPNKRLYHPTVLLLISSLVIFSGGMFLGTNVGTIGSTIMYQAYLSNCSLYTSNVSCAAAGHRPLFGGGGSAAASPPQCFWNATEATCVFVKSGGRSCPTASVRTREQCDALDLSLQCTWYNGGCVTDAGWTPVQQGLLGSLMTVGGLCQSAVASVYLRFKGSVRKMLPVAGIVAFVGSFVLQYALSTPNTALALCCRAVSGIGVGMSITYSILYIGFAAPLRYRRIVGSLFSIGVTFGILIMGFVAYYTAESTLDWATVTDVPRRYQVVLACCTASGLLMLVAGLVAFTLPMDEAQGGDSAANIGHTTSTADTGVQTPLQLAGDADHERRSLLMQALTALALTVSIQWTGINLMISYAPVVATGVGFTPLLTTLIVDAWNFLMCVVAIPIVARFGNCRCFLVGSLAAVIANATLAIATVPGLFPDQTSQIIVGIGSLMFIGAFEIGIGVPYYPLTSRVFQPPYQEVGAVFVLVTEGVLSFINSSTIPLIIDAFSTLKTGQFVTFLVSCGCGLLSFLLLRWQLKESKDYG